MTEERKQGLGQLSAGIRKLINDLELTEVSCKLVATDGPDVYGKEISSVGGERAVALAGDTSDATNGI